MDDKQYWEGLLDDFLQFRRDDGKADGTVEDDKAIVGQWIRYALEQSVEPDERNDELLRQWVTVEMDLATRAQDSYRSHVGQWWKWWWEVEPPPGDPPEQLAEWVADFRSDGYSRERDNAQLLARERFERVLRKLPTMPWADRQQLKELWRKNRNADYGGPGQIVQLNSLIDGANEAEWEALRNQITALCFGGVSLAERLQKAVDEIRGLGWTTATRLAAISDPERVIPNYSLHTNGAWAGKLDNLQMLMDERLLEADTRRRAQRVLRDHPQSKPSGRAVVEANDLLLEILRPHFTDGDVVDTWGMRTFLDWLSRFVADHDEPAEPTAADENDDA
ncbi:hypothetical protein [Candidatus Poriferisodalis sp.]|uniref:hypothetical protein n=1 Tax=Candidatus Poriferisodalis sp. TaxID=3101277 RepID=UPI003B521855